MRFEMLLALLHASARQREQINAQLAREEKKETEKITRTLQAGGPQPD
jgi:cytochrome c-type biogenesis protein CcmH/NrfG